MENHESGYTELDHTADWSVHVWAPTLPKLFEQAARAMYALTGAELRIRPRRFVPIQLDAPDAEGLLVAFLNELLYRGEEQGLGFVRYELEVSDTHLEGQLRSAPLVAISKEIKAVTYHGLEIRHTERGVEATIIFDV